VLEAGVNPVTVARSVYDSNNMGRLKLFGAVLSAMQLDSNGRIAIVYLDHEMARAAGGTYEDTEGLINLPLTVKEIQAVVFFKQIEGEQFRVSMRSKGEIDIGAVAKEFAGGGHKNAAGCSVTGAIDALQKLFIEKVGQAIQVELETRDSELDTRHSKLETS
jgi:phosphoesterase RecJ-like protein